MPDDHRSEAVFMASLSQARQNTAMHGEDSHNKAVHCPISFFPPGASLGVGGPMCTVTDMLKRAQKKLPLKRSISVNKACIAYSRSTHYARVQCA